MRTTTSAPIRSLGLYAAGLALAAASLSPYALARDQEARQAPAPTAQNQPRSSGMQVIHHAAQNGQRGHGWQYFSDPRARRAVVISPQGDYYFSQHGKGLRWVAADLTII